MAVGNTNYPGSLDTTTNLPVASALSGVQMDGDGNDNKKHSNLHGVISESIVQLETKIGTGSSTASSTTVLAGTGSGTSAWTSTPAITGVGALNAGSITSGFEGIDIGSSALAAGTIDAATDFTIGSLVITDDQIQMTPTTSDTVTIAAAANGALNITTVDNAANAANLTVTIDGSITLDSVGNIELDAATGIWIFEDGGTEVLRIFEGNTGDVTIKLVTNAKDLIFTDNGDTAGLTIKDDAAGIVVPGEVMTTKISYTDGDDAMVIADGGGVTFGTDAYLADDKKLYFGAAPDASIEYDEDGTDQLRVSGKTVFDNDMEIADSKFIEFASAAGTPTSNDGAQGVVIEFLAFHAIAQWDCVYASTTTGRVGKADANSLASMPAIGVAIEAAGSAGDSVRVLTHGVFRDDGGFGGAMTPGVDLYVPEVPGTPTTTIPDADGDFVQVMGVAVGARSAFINPSMDVIERA
jgi:hypothetical protein